MYILYMHTYYNYVSILFISIQCSPELKISGAIGPCVSLNRKGPSVADNVSVRVRTIRFHCRLYTTLGFSLSLLLQPVVPVQLLSVDMSVLTKHLAMKRLFLLIVLL